MVVCWGYGVRTGLMMFNGDCGRMAPSMFFVKISGGGNGEFKCDFTYYRDSFWFPNLFPSNLSASFPMPMARELPGILVGFILLQTILLVVTFIMAFGSMASFAQEPRETGITGQGGRWFNG